MDPLLTRAAALALLAVGAGQAQPSADGGPVVARYSTPDGERIVSRDDLALELYRRFGDTEQGKSALSFLIDLELIRGAADAAGVMPNRTDTQRWVRSLEQRLLAAGMNLDQLRRQKGMSERAFEDYAAIQLAQERLVRRALDLGEDEPVEPAMLTLWLQEARGKLELVTDRSALPGGTVARFGDRSLSQLDLGRVLVGTLDADVRQRYVRQIVLRRLIAARAAAAGIEVTPAQMRREVAQRQREAETNPAYQGVPFAELLAAQGTSIEELQRSPILEAQIQERELLDRALPPAEVERLLRDERAAVLREHGARRQLSLILVGAGRERAEEARQSIVDGLPFADAARQYSDDPYTRVSGGDAGWQHRAGSELPAAVLDAAFAASIHGLSLPIETDQGCYLVRVTGIEPEPNDATLGFRLRQTRSLALRRELLQAADIRLLQEQP